MGSFNFDFELFSPDSYLGIFRDFRGKGFRGRAIGVRGRGVLKGLLVGRRGEGFNLGVWQGWQIERVGRWGRA